MDNTDDITVLSLCTGYGGLELGLHRALGRPLRVVAVEIEAFAAANLVAKAEEGKLAIEALLPDIKTFPAERFSGCFDFILAGYPCQPFSSSGSRRGTKDPRHLWPYIEQHIKAIRPVFCFFENVRGHLRVGYPDVYRSLRNLNYTVEQGIFSAAETGAIHLRERLFILAANADCVCNWNVAGRNGVDARKEEEGKWVSNWRGIELVVGKVAPTEWRRAGEVATKPLLVRGDDGSGTIMERLRLLGNGVVPAQAELAFRTLYGKLTK